MIDLRLRAGRDGGSTREFRVGQQRRAFRGLGEPGEARFTVRQRHAKAEQRPAAACIRRNRDQNGKNMLIAAIATAKVMKFNGNPTRTKSM